MATKINVRSPFYLKVAQTNIATATLNLYIYTGTFVANASVANPKYTITKSVVTSGYIVFEVAELIRDYLDITFNGTYDSQVVWVNAIISTTVSSGSATATVKPDNTNGFVAFDGYGYYEDGANPTNAKTIDTGSLQSNQVIFRLNDENVRVPVYTGITDSVTFLFEGTVKRTQSVSTSTNTNAQIDYDNKNNATKNKYAKKIFEELFKEGIKCEVDLRNEKINYKVREHSLAKIPMIIVCGKKEVKDKTVTVRILGSEKQETIEREKLIKNM